MIYEWGLIKGMTWKMTCYDMFIIYFNRGNNWFVPKSLAILARIKYMYIVTGTCFIPKINALSSSLLQGKYLPFSLPHFASIVFAYLWSFRWPNYIVTLPRYLSFRQPHLIIPTGPPSDELDKNIQRTSLRLLFSHWNGYSHFRFALDFSHAFGIL